MNAIAQVSAAAPLSGPKLDNRRVLAAIVDLLIVSAGAVVILYAGDSLTGDRQGALGAVITGWALYYYFALESGAGQTVGKKLLKLRVVRADGRPAGMGEIAVRTILRVVDGIGVYIVGLIVMLVTGQRRQRIGDLAAGTIVVDASGPAANVAPPAAEVDDAGEQDADYDEPEPYDEPAASAAPSQTITLPSRPTPATLADIAAPEAVEEATGEADSEPDAEDEPSADAEPYDMDALDSDADAEEPVADEEPLPPVMSPSLEGLAADVAAAKDTDPVDDGDETLATAVPVPAAEPADDATSEAEAEAERAPAEHEEMLHEGTSEPDEPVNVKSVETVSAMDLIMGAAAEDSAKSGEDEGPLSA